MCFQVRFILSDSAQWERNNGAFQGEEFFKHIVKVLRKDSPWSRGVIADWNAYVRIGVHLHILTPHASSGMSTDQRASVSLVHPPLVFSPAASPRLTHCSTNSTTRRTMVRARTRTTPEMEEQPRRARPPSKRLLAAGRQFRRSPCIIIVYSYCAPSDI